MVGKRSGVWGGGRKGREGDGADHFNAVVLADEELFCIYLNRTRSFRCQISEITINLTHPCPSIRGNICTGLGAGVVVDVVMNVANVAFS